VASVLLAGFSFVFKEHVAMAIAEECQRLVLTLTIAKSRLKRDSKLIRMIPLLRLLACLSRGFPIVGVPVRLCGDGEVVGDCCSLLMCFQIYSIQINSNL
jgi:hypothetical protein